MSFQPVTMQDFQVLIDKGFIPSDEHSGREIVLVRRHEKNAQLIIKVYTSISRGSTVCREAGADAIRVALVREDPKTGFKCGVGKSKRVNRTGPAADVVGRVLERARELWKLGCTR